MWFWLWAAVVGLVAPIAATVAVVALAKSHPHQKEKAQKTERLKEPEEVELPPLDWVVDEVNGESDSVAPPELPPLGYVDDETPWWCDM